MTIERRVFPWSRWSLAVAAALLLVALFLGGRWVRTRYLSGPSPEVLGRAFAHAVEVIRLHQEIGGYWRTVRTLSPQFEGRHISEVNVWVPSLMVDLLAPVARDAGATDVVQRAREFLGNQIEETGLARYHGRPDHRLGCDITPDADDTALLWRLAPRKDEALLRSALRALEEYRTAEGFYPIWLASPDAYRCFNPGSHSNPVDVGVQMNVYLFLVEHNQRAAQELCATLQQRISEDRLWVWYTIAPLLPLLREIDLTRAGCPVRVPESRFAKAPPGQEQYIRLGRLFRDLLLDRAPRKAALLRTLQYLAEGGFRRVEETPPLLYHNDLSSKDLGYYWSKDVAYALWLRTYVEVARRWPGSLQLPASLRTKPEGALNRVAASEDRLGPPFTTELSDAAARSGPDSGHAKPETPAKER